MYYICKFSDTCTVYDAKANTTRLLRVEEIETLKLILPSLLGNDSKILSAIKVEALKPNKLLQLSLPGKSDVPVLKLGKCFDATVTWCGGFVGFDCPQQDVLLCTIIGLSR